MITLLFLPNKKITKNQKKGREMQRIFTVGVLLVLGGCINNYPIPLDEPTEEDSVTMGKIGQADARIAKPERPSKLESPLAKPKNLEDLKLNVRLYQDHYFYVHNKMMRNDTGSDDVGIFGGMVGVIGGLVSSSSTVYTGAGLASGASIYSQRYKMTEQARNYRRASKAMTCVLIQLSPTETDVAPSNKVVAPASLKVEEIRERLYDAQSSVTLGETDIKELALSWQKTQDAERARRDAETARNAQRSQVETAKLVWESEKKAPRTLTSSNQKEMKYESEASALAIKQGALEDANDKVIEASIDECVKGF